MRFAIHQNIGEHEETTVIKCDLCHGSDLTLINKLETPPSSYTFECNNPQCPNKPERLFTKVFLGRTQIEEL